MSTPAVWERVKLEDSIQILDSVRVPVNNTERQERIAGKTDSELYPYYGATGEVGKIDDYLFDEELVALGEDGVPFLDGNKPKAYMLHGKTWVNNHAHVLKAIDGITTNKYVLHFLNQFDYQGYVNGGTRLKLTQANMRCIPMPLPPLAEQNQIASKLDELLTQVGTIKTRLGAIPAILKRFRQSVLAAAVSGRLTEEWRVENPGYNAAQQINNIKHQRVKLFELLNKTDKPLKRQANPVELESVPLSWCYSHIDPFLSIERAGMKTGPFGSLLKKHEHTRSGVPVLGIENINQGVFLEGSKIHISEKKAKELASYDIQQDDLIISRSGSVGDICVIPPNLGDLRFSTNIMRLSFLENSINPQFFSRLFLGSPIVLKQVAELCRGSTRLFLNQKILSSISYPIPPIEEQAEIIRRIEQLFSFADQIELRVKTAQARVNQITQSILAKAFRGELTAEWREQNPDLISGENSVQALLERIKAEQDKLTPAKRGRRKKAVAS